MSSVGLPTQKIAPITSAKRIEGDHFHSPSFIQTNSHQ